MKPQIIAITRKFNLGNYQTMDIHVEASVNENENVVDALMELEKLIMDFWEGKTDKLVSMARKEK